MAQINYPDFPWLGTLWWRDGGSNSAADADSSCKVRDMFVAPFDCRTGLETCSTQTALQRCQSRLSTRTRRLGLARWSSAEWSHSHAGEEPGVQAPTSVVHCK